MILTATRGDDVTIAIPVTADQSTASELTFTVKRQIGDTDADAVLTKELAAGEVEVASATSIEVTLAAADTDDLEAPAVFIFDLEAISAENHRTTIAIGYFRLAADVTRDAAIGS